MKKIQFCLLFVLIFASFSAFSQSKITKKTTKSKAKTEKNTINLKERLWYGGSLNLGGGSYSLDQFTPGNIFIIGLSPMVGYKFNKYLSAGPRIGWEYNYGRFDQQGTILKYSAADYSFGLFGRLKFLNVLFLHAEFNRSSSTFITGAINANNKLETERVWDNHLLAGLGYNPGGIMSYDLYLLWDFLAPKNTTNLPIQIRGGLTYNF